MAAVLRTETAPAAPVAVTGPDRRQWWAEVQAGVSALLTDAARPAPGARPAR